MKKILVLLGLMMAAIVALTGCQTEFGTEMVRGKALTVSASTDAGTKTVNDGMSTLWAEGDKISVFYADAGGTNYSEGIELTLSEGAGTKGGVFVDAAEASVAPDGSHDWYAIYPSGPKSPASNSAEGGFTYLGDTRGLTQEGYNSTNVLCGTACPMYGVVKSESGNPGFVMKQLATVIEFNVVNKTGNPVKVTRVTLDETETETPIIGSFYVDFTGEKPEFTPSEDASKVKTKAQVTVNGATELAEEETAKIYLPVVPYAHDPMKPFRVAIDGEIGGKAAYQEFAIDVPANKCLFEAGKIRRVHVVLDEMTLLEGNTISDVMSGNVGDNYVVSDALVTMVYNKGFFAQDGTGTILVYMNAAPSVAKGDKVDINGVTSSYSNMVQFKQPAVSPKSSGNTVSLTPVPYTGTEVNAAAQNATQAYVSLTATLTSATAATVEGAEATLSLTAATNPAVSLTSGKKYNLTGYVYGYYNGKVYLYVDSAEEVGGTEPQPTSSTIADAHAATSGTSIAMDDLLVAEVFPQGFMVTDNKDILFVFLKEAPTVSKGDKVSVEGTVGVYKGNKQIKEDPKPTITASGTGTVTLSPVEWTGEDVASAYVDNNAKYVKLTATATSTVNATVEGAGEKVLYIANNQKASGVTIEKDKTYNLTGYVYGHGTYSGTEQVYFYAESAEEVTGDDPGPGPEPGGDETIVSWTMSELMTAKGYEKNKCYTTLELSSSVRMSTTGEPNCGAFFGTSPNNDWRLYQNKNGNLTVSVADGCSLKLVQLTFSVANNGQLYNGNDVVATGTTAIECEGSSITFTVGGTADNGQVKVTAVKVVYTGSGEFDPLPDPEPEETQTSITMAGSKNVYVGDTVELGATCNVAEATIVYQSEDTSIATVSDAGVVTGVAAGVVKVYARVTGVPGQYTDAERYCTVTVQEQPQQQEGEWHEFGISNIQEGDEFVIVGNGYALSSANGTSDNPPAVAVTVDNGKITSDVTNVIVWTLKGNTTDGFTFYPKDNSDKYLYCNTTAASKNNTNLRVGTTNNNRNVFVLKSKDNCSYLVTKDEYVERYVCVYISDSASDWRGYVEASANGTDTKFYKKAVRQ
jgi:DNA/RNA endonuclease YhcR with UshA esterase domain